MSLPTTRARLYIHGFVRIMEILLLYGHFCGATIFAGDVVIKTQNYNLHPALFALPGVLIAGLILLFYFLVFLRELKSAGLPRAPELSVWQGRVRQILRILIMAGIVVCFLTLIFFIALRFIAYKNAGNFEDNWPLVSVMSAGEQFA
jgi:hypothetical protein